jgi:hypothetical protein
MCRTNCTKIYKAIDSGAAQKLLCNVASNYASSEEITTKLSQAEQAVILAAANDGLYPASSCVAVCAFNFPLPDELNIDFNLTS